MRSRFTILLLLFSVRIFLGPVTFTFDARSQGNIEEAFNNIKLHKRRASFIDLQRSGISSSFLPASVIQVSEPIEKAPMRISHRRVQPQVFADAAPYSVRLLVVRVRDPLQSRKEILLI